MKLCNYDEDADEYFPVTMPQDYIRSFYIKIKFGIINYLDRDTKHAFICKLIHRHKKPLRVMNEQTTTIGDALKLSGKQFAQSISNSILDSFSPWYCVRCGEEQQLNLMIDSDLITENSSFATDWKEYCKTIELPKLIYNFPPGSNSPEPTNLKNEEKNS